MNPHAATGAAARHYDAIALSQALRSARADTLATFAALQAALGEVPQVPQRDDLNPPLWELGHIGWFQAHFLRAAPGRVTGQVPGPTTPDDTDALYDSSQVPHATRWDLPLPGPAATQATLAAQLDAAQAQLARCDGTDESLYRHRLVLFHEDMHHEAALYMAQALAVPVDGLHGSPPRLTTPRRELHLGAGAWTLGWQGPGFAFDNELRAHEVELPACWLDSRVLTWAEYLPFVEATGAPPPRYLRRSGAAQGWQRLAQGRWIELDAALPACHLSLAQAQAWCAWAGRRLPTEAEWERAALSEPAFDWGAVWEWTASPFTPYPGFEAHLYADYSAPWFGARQVLRGASFMTQPRLHHAKYRNFFTADRTDVAVGFRSCAAAGPESA